MRSPPGKAELPSLFTLPRGGLLGRRMAGRCKCTGSPSGGWGRAAGSKQQQRPGLRRGRGRRLRPGRQQGWARPRGLPGRAGPARETPPTLPALCHRGPAEPHRRRSSPSDSWRRRTWLRVAAAALPPAGARRPPMTSWRPPPDARGGSRERGRCLGARTAPPRVRGAL